MNNIKENRRRSFIKFLGAGALITASTTFARERRGTSVVELSEEQKDTLFYIFQEEKVARDVYITLGKRYADETTFSEIQISEQEHILTAQVLCERYGMDTSSVNLSLEDDYIGQFELHEMQELYNQCIELGEVSLLEALKVGLHIEVTDIEDLEKAAEGMPWDVVNVYENLKNGSLDHLDAFEKAIARES